MSDYDQLMGDADMLGLTSEVTVPSEHWDAERQTFVPGPQPGTLKWYWRRFGNEKPPVDELLLLFDTWKDDLAVVRAFKVSEGEWRWQHESDEVTDVPRSDQLWIRAAELPALPSGRRVGE